MPQTKRVQDQTWLSDPFLHFPLRSFGPSFGQSFGQLLVSHLEGKGAEDEKGITLSKKLFETSPAFNIGATVVFIIVALLYAIFW